MTNGIHSPSKVEHEGYAKSKYGGIRFAIATTTNVELLRWLSLLSLDSLRQFNLLE